MPVTKTFSTMALRFLLCFFLCACLWITSVIFRTLGKTFTELYPFGLAAAACFVGICRLYITRPPATLIFVTCSIVLIAVVDQLWDAYGYFDDYKGVKDYDKWPALVSIALGLISFYYKGRFLSAKWVLPLCWGALICVMLAMSTHILTLRPGMIGSRYILVVLLSLVVAEMARLYQNYKSGAEFRGHGGDTIPN